MSINVVIVNFELICTHRSGVFIVDFEEVNDSWKK